MWPVTLICLAQRRLFHLVSMAATAPGIKTLANWLAGPAEATVAIERASAVDALAPLRDQRLRFYTLARQVGDSTGDPEQFVDWATGDPWLAKRQWLVTWAKISSADRVPVVRDIDHQRVWLIAVGCVPMESDWNRRR